jgi:ketosteroid isomerase-like protein
VHDTTSPSGDDASLPETVKRYQDAHDRHDTDIALSAFAPDAAVFDDGKEFHGTDEIRTWLTTAASEYTFTRTLVSAEPVDDDTWLVVNHLEGNFPGGIVDLRYRFALRDGLIAELVIAP